jgi:hypothetical protein
MRSLSGKSPAGRTCRILCDETRFSETKRVTKHPLIKALKKNGDQFTVTLCCDSSGFAAAKHYDNKSGARQLFVVLRQLSFEELNRSGRDVLAPGTTADETSALRKCERLAR